MADAVTYLPHWSVPKGAGKTRLFRMVVGEETPDEGAVSVRKKLTIGYVRQDGQYTQRQSVGLNVQCPCCLRA